MRRQELAVQGNGKGGRLQLRGGRGCCAEHPTRVWTHSPAVNSMKLCHSPKTTVLGPPCGSTEEEKQLGTSDQG